ILSVKHKPLAASDVKFLWKQKMVVGLIDVLQFASESVEPPKDRRECHSQPLLCLQYLLHGNTIPLPNWPQQSFRKPPVGFQKRTCRSHSGLLVLHQIEASLASSTVNATSKPRVYRGGPSVEPLTDFGEKKRQAHCLPA